jgi:hypothetical protein
MPYSDRDYKTSNVNYLNKDFNSLKSTLIEYAKTYFPNSYRDFNETSPGMMLIEMGAYVGDVLSFYIDQQYKEMLLPLAEEKRNVINLANALGYKVKPITPAYVNLSITQVLGTTGDVNNLTPNYATATQIPIRTQVQSSADSTLIFETLDVVDFKVSGSVVEVNSKDDNGIVSDYKLTKKVKAISAETKTKTFTIGTPQKFLTLTLDETNVVDIISVKDLNDNEYFQVDYLAQDHVPIETYYTGSTTMDDVTQGVRTSAYSYFDNAGTVTDVAVPYALSYHRTSKKFVIEVNDDDTTSLVFGNGILRNGQLNQSNLLQTEQVGLIIPGETQNFDSALDPLINNDNRSTLGETPANTTLTVTYRVGGGTSANSAVGDLTTFVTSPGGTTTVTNETPAYGGSAGQSVEEIRAAARAFFATQNRCVTQEDYEARTLAMPAKFGGIAKVFCGREVGDYVSADITTPINTLQSAADDLQALIDSVVTMATDSDLNPIRNQIDGVIGTLTGVNDSGGITPELISATINLHILSYNENGKLVPATNPTNSITHPLKQNLKSYLNQYRLLTDEVNIIDGKVINFGVQFEVTSHRSANKADVKLRVIDSIRNYFTTDKMQFRQPIYISDLEYEIMGLDGVRAVNELKLVQTFTLPDGTDGDILYLHTLTGSTGDSNYNWQYDFTEANKSGVILPSVEPSVFELKFPNKDIRGKVL